MALRVVGERPESGHFDLRFGGRHFSGPFRVQARLRPGCGGSSLAAATIYNRWQMTPFASSLQSIDWRWVWLSVAAFLAGVLNAVAGGGSFLLFPAMLGMKMLPVQANATNTVALWPGQLTSIAAYWEDIRKNMRLALPMGLAGFLGGTAGAIVLLNTPQTTFLHLVPWLLLVAASIFAATGPVTRWLARRNHRAADSPAPSHRLLFVFLCTIVVCFYIGYFGAGAGFLLITLLSLFGFEDLNEINALKVVATTMANGVAFLIFVVGRQVEWHYCLLAMITCAIGGYTSARFARKIPAPLLRGTVIFIGFAIAAWFFWRNR
jgi:uncharacterized membrane protein YfcA